MGRLDDFLFTRRRRQKIIPANNRQTTKTETRAAPIMMMCVARTEFPCLTVESGVTLSKPVTAELSSGFKLSLGLEREHGGSRMYV
jgi:hypothetical protein